MRSKKQQTMAKMTRERMVKERRALKLEKKQAAAAAKAAGTALPTNGAEGETDVADPAASSEAPEGQAQVSREMPAS